MNYEKVFMFVGSYIFYDREGKLRHGAEYGISQNEKTFIAAMQEDVRRDWPESTHYEGAAWRMSDQGMQAVARHYMQRYIEPEYG